MLEYSVIEDDMLLGAIRQLNKAAADGWLLDQVIRAPLGDKQLWVLIIRRLRSEELEEKE